ncbi:hypothetical protein AK830_g2730 [Neonectria ditissima]|uniref:Heterokaryon incompatibility domain-containing protein n=1 Tax=Neonectria ditissima TaxID=78410 RepID=A0A0N8H871_9HYPO|nr:hypothetical protein AK830_g2730 [Neonectria ditissima]
MATQYQYDYIGPGWIRVLRLVSLTPEVILDIEPVYLDSDPTYYALSYTWGKSVFTSRVFIRDRFLNVTPGLHECLQYLNLYVGSRIWIDAICINQVDNDEKAYQVQAMARVYRQAAKVLAWLGPSADDSDIAIKGIAAWGKAASDAGILDIGPDTFSKWPDVGEDPKLVRTRDTLLSLMQRAADTEGDESRIDERVPRVALASLTNRLYFIRVWVKQEMTLAENAVILCGASSTTVEYFHAIILFYGLLQPWEISEWRAGRMKRIPGPFSEEQLMAVESPWDLLKTASASDAAGRLLSGRRRYRQEGTEPLFRHLHNAYVRPTAQVLDCGDPRDKIWGLLGIAGDSDQLGLKASYTVDTEFVYETTARALLHQGYISILKWCRTRQVTSPSWVPNWVLPVRNPWSEDLGMPLFKATGTKRQPNVGHTRPDPPGCIRLYGIRVDSIADIGSVWQAGMDDSFDQAIFRTMAGELRAFLEKSRYPEHQKVEAMWRIPIGDKEFQESNPYFVRATERSKTQFLALASKTMDSDMMAATYSYQACMGYNYMARPIFSENGYVGIGPSEVQPGDIVVLLFGGDTPFVLRPLSGGNEGYLLVGEVYVYGIMDGELAENEDSTAMFDLW